MRAVLGMAWLAVVLFRRLQRTEFGLDEQQLLLYLNLLQREEALVNVILRLQLYEVLLRLECALLLLELVLQALLYTVSHHLLVNRRLNLCVRRRLIRVCA